LQITLGGPGLERTKLSTNLLKRLNVHQKGDLFFRQPGENGRTNFTSRFASENGWKNVIPTRRKESGGGCRPV